MGSKREIGIVELLEWAFNDELPKGGGSDGIAGVRSAWGRIMRWSELMTEVYQGAGVMEFIERTGDPHPDAVKVGRAVAALADLVLDLPDDWNPLNMANLTPSARAAVSDACAMIRGTDDGKRLSLLPVGIVVRCAVLRRAPEFPMDIRVTERPVMHNGRPAWFVRRKVKDAFGVEREIEVDGYNPKSGRPVAGAYHKWEYPREVVADIAARAEWQVWRAALDILAIDLKGALDEFDVMATDLPLEPWVEGLPERKQRVIRPDLMVRAGRKSPVLKSKSVVSSMA